MLVKIIDRNTAKTKELEILNNIPHGIDVITDENITLETYNKEELFVNDLVFIQEKEREYIYLINSIEDSKKFTITSFLDIFNQDIYVEDLNMNLKELIYNNFINNVEDSARNIFWLNVDNIDDTIFITASENIVNVKTLLLDTIYKYRTSFFTVNKLNDNIVELHIPISATSRIINLHVPSILNLEIPKLKTGKNTIDIITDITEEYTYTDDTGSSQTGTKVVETTKETYVLLKNNTISTDVSEPTRILPPEITTQKVTRKQGEVSTSLDVAETALIDDSKYSISFALHKENKLYDLSSANIGDVFDLYYFGVAYRTILTGILVDGDLITYKFGRKRIDIVYSIKKLRRK